MTEIKKKVKKGKSSELPSSKEAEKGEKEPNAKLPKVFLEDKICTL